MRRFTLVMNLVFVIGLAGFATTCAVDNYEPGSTALTHVTGIDSADPVVIAHGQALAPIDLAAAGAHAVAVPGPSVVVPPYGTMTPDGTQPEAPCGWCWDAAPLEAPIGIHQPDYSVEVPPICDISVLPIVAGQHYDAGTLTVWSDGTHLLAHAVTHDGWHLEYAQVYVGYPNTAPTQACELAPGQFPYHNDFNGEAPTSVTLYIDIGALGFGCDELVEVAAHFVAVKVDGTHVQRETAWAYGPIDFGNSSWGRCFGYGLCCL